MARTTRSKPKPAAQEHIPTPIISTIKPLPASTSNPPKLFVLPKNTSPGARIVTLENPATGTLSRYFFCPAKGFYEFTRIAAPRKECRSWLITGEEKGEKEGEGGNKNGDAIGSGYITKSSDLFIATPIDLLFLVLPAFAPKTAKDAKPLFLALEDYLDKLSGHWRALLSQHSSLKVQIEKKVRTVCDTVDAGDEIMYRLSHAKLVGVLCKKAERMVKHGLPRSLEEKFVKSVLEVPVMSVRREDSSLSGVEVETTISTESQTSKTTSTESQETTITTPDTSADDLISKPALSTPPEIPHLLRLRTSLTYLTSSYLPSTLSPHITTLLSAQTSPSFTPLDQHLSALASLKHEAAALRSISDNISRKRALDDDEDRIAEREEKKRKKEEEEKKKKTEGRGIKQLKKVDTSGMRKMSSFFTKAVKKA